MTRLEIAEKACERLRKEDNHLSCIALDIASGSRKASMSYARFYWKNPDRRWWPIGQSFCEHSHERQMCIIFWATAPASIRKEVMP